MRHSAILLTAILAVASTVHGQAPEPDRAAVPPTVSARSSYVQVSAEPSHTAVAPGGRFHLAVEILIDDGWVFYSPDPGEVAKPATITVQAEQFSAGEALWPIDQTYETDLGAGEKIVNNIYKKRAIVYVPLVARADAKLGAAPIAVVVDGQICKGVCIGINAAAEATVTVGPEAAINDAWTAALSAGLDKALPAAELASARTGQTATPTTTAGQADQTVWAGLGLALLAGLILNIMPCVLPVIPLRVLGLVQMAGERRRRFVALGLAFAGGIVLFFVALAAANLIFSLVAQQTLNLNMHFQYRPVRIALAMVLVALAGNLFGLFQVTVPAGLAGRGAGAAQRSGGGYASAVGMGLMMAVLATPCSFAVLVAALAWAQLQPLPLATLGIIAIGVGMAAPHAVLVAFPSLVRKLPKPGTWMEMLREGMGLLLLPVAIWLIFAGANDAYTGWIVAYAVVLMMCLWVWGRWVRYDASLRRKLAVRVPAVALAVAAGFWMLTPPKPTAVTFEPFSHQRIDNAHGNGQTVLVKFTSATCLSCIWVDRTVYNDGEVADRLARHNIVVLKADTTDADMPASKMLRNRFNGAPPLTVLLPPAGGEAVRLEGKFSKAELFSALEKLANGP